MHKSAFLHFHFHYPNRSWSWMVLWRPTGPSRTNTKKTNQLTKNMIGKKKSCHFHHRELECKNRKLRDTWDDRQVWPWSTNEAGQRLTEFCQENTLVIETTDNNNTTDNSTHGHHQMVNTEIRLIIFFVAEDGEAVYSQQKQDRELTVPQIMNSLLQNSDSNWKK